MSFVFTTRKSPSELFANDPYRMSVHGGGTYLLGPASDDVMVSRNPLAFLTISIVTDNRFPAAAILVIYISVRDLVSLGRLLARLSSYPLLKANASFDSTPFSLQGNGRWKVMGEEGMQRNGQLYIFKRYILHALLRGHRHMWLKYLLAGQFTPMSLKSPNK